MLRRVFDYLRPDKQILLIPHRDGILIFEGRPRQRLDPAISRVIELFAAHPGRVLAEEEIAAVLWPGKWPEDWGQRVMRRIHEVRQVLPPNFISTERRGHKAIGWRLIQEIKVENFHAQP